MLFPNRPAWVIRTAPEGFVRITLSINAFGIDLPGLTVGGHWK